MACGVSTVACLGLLAALAPTGCRKSESDTGNPLDGAAMPSGMSEPDGAATPDAAATAADGGAADATASADLAGVSGTAGKFKPPSGDFGSVRVGQQSEPQTFTFGNDGDQATGTLATQLGGPDAPSFAIVEDRCNGTTLPPAAACSITLRFQPRKAGELAASLALAVPPRGSAVLVVGGTGIEP